MARKKSLGKSMDALFDNQGKISLGLSSSESQKEGIRNISIDLLHPSNGQPRTIFDEDKILQLSESIKSQGIIQPIVASKDENSNLFHIIAGERRWRAAQKAGLKKVPVIVRDFDATNASIVALVENLHREDLNPIDKARGLSELIHTHKLRQQDLATEVGMSRASIANLLRLLKLSKKVQKSVISCEISEGHAKVLAGLPISEQELFLKKIQKYSLSVRQLENEIQKEKSGNEVKQKSKKNIDDKALRPVVDFFEEFFSMKVTIQEQGKAKGKVSFHYNTHEELESMIDKLGVDVENRF